MTGPSSGTARLSSATARGVYSRQGEPNMLIHVHTLPFTFTPHQPNAGATAPAFGDHTRLGLRSQSRSTIIHVHTSPFTFTPRQPNAGATAPAFGDHTRLIPRSQSRSTIIHVYTSPAQPDCGTPPLTASRLHLGMESVCEAGQSLIAGHLQVQVHSHHLWSQPRASGGCVCM